MSLGQRFLRMSIRWQITIASVVLLVGAFAVVSWLAFGHSARVMLGLMLDRLESEAAAAESVVQRKLQDVHGAIQALATSPSFRTAVAAALSAPPERDAAAADSGIRQVHELFQLSLRQERSLAGCLLCRPDGTPLVAEYRAPPEGAQLQSSASGSTDSPAPPSLPGIPPGILRDVCRRATQRSVDRPFVSDVVLLPLPGGRAGIFVAAPLSLEQPKRGTVVLAAVVDADKLFGSVRDVIRDADVDIVDQQGRYLLCTRNPGHELSARRYEQDKPVRAELLARSNGPDTYRNVIDGSRRPDGRSLVAIYRKVYFDPADRTRFWAIAPDVDVASLMTVYERFRNTVLVWIVLVVGIAVVGNYLASGTLTASLLRLADAAKRIAAGELHTPIPDVPPIGELPILGGALRAMTENLRQTIAQIQKRREELQSVLDSTADGIVVIDTDGVIQLINQSACTMFGFDREELLGQNVNRLMPAEIAREHDEYIRRYLQTGQRRIIGTEREVTGRRKDGTTLPVALRVTEATIEGRETFIGTVQDITERKRLADQRSKTLAGLQAAVRELTTTSQQIVQLGREESDVVTEQMASVSQTTSAIRQIEAAAQQTAQRAREIARSAADARHVADDGLAAVRQAVEAMNEVATRVDDASGHIVSLADRAQAISQIIATVNEIAEQTNLLALNAAIEASRAGEHGKGFAVVAGEVKSLAEESKAATEQIRKILSEIQQATNRAVMSTEQGTRSVTHSQRIVTQARDTINKLAEVVHHTGDAMQQIVDVTGQQVVGIGQISGAMSDIAAGAQQLQQHTQHLVQAADVLSHTADELDHLARNIR
ncbi:MAG: PAS domain S-box protein [Planctomycetota bacterium]|nr:MAG: PAS domain S-box protein [Planctomycetota bacterium]